MKKQIQNLLKHSWRTLLLVLTLITTSQGIWGGVSAIYLVMCNESGLENPYIYTLNNSNQHQSGVWPGESLASYTVGNVKGLYYYNGATGNFDKLKISKNGGAPNTGDITIGAGDLVAFNGGGTYTYNGTTTIFRVKKTGLFGSSAPYLHYWGNGYPETQWPGFQMYDDPNNSSTWWMIEIYGSPSEIIFHDNNGKQTNNIAPGDNRCFSVSDEKIDNNSNRYKYSTETCPAACTAPNIQTDVSSAAANYCVGTDPASVTALSVVLSGGTEPYSYQWYKNSSASTSGATLIDDATSSSYKPLTTASEVGSNYYYCIVSSECGQSRQSGYSGAITVYDTSVSGSITGGGTYCQGEAGSTQTLTLSSSRGSIQWHGSTTSDFTPDNTTEITGADNVTYGAPISSSGTTYYKAVVTNGVCAPATTAAQATVEVLPNPAPGTASANGSTGEINIDDGDDVALTLTGYEAGEGVAIKWYKSIDNSVWVLADTPDPLAANYPSYTDEGVSQTTWYKAKVTKNSCTKYSNVIKVNAVTRIYFKVQSTSGCDPESDNAWFSLYCNLGGETCTRYRMWSYDRLNKIYYADVEAIGAVQYFIIDRVQGNHYDTDGSGVLWRTPNLPNDNTGRGAHNMWTASGCDTSTNPNGMTGSWSTFDPSTINEMPSLYIKGPLLTGNWGAYDKTAWDSETKDEVTGDYIYTKAFVANVTYGGTESDEGKFTICLSTTEGNDTKLPNFYEQPGKTLSRTGISVVGSGVYKNFKPDPMSSAGQYVTLTVVRHSLTNFEVSYCAGPVITQSPASPNPWEQVTLTLTSPSSSTATWELISNPTDEGYLSTQPDDAAESTVLKAPYSSSAYKVRTVVSGGSGCSGTAIVDVRINSEACN